MGPKVGSPDICRATIFTIMFSWSCCCFTALGSGEKIFNHRERYRTLTKPVTESILLLLFCSLLVFIMCNLSGSQCVSCTAIIALLSTSIFRCFHHYSKAAILTMFPHNQTIHFCFHTIKSHPIVSTQSNHTLQFPHNQITHFCFPTIKPHTFVSTKSNHTLLFLHNQTTHFCFYTIKPHTSVSSQSNQYTFVFQCMIKPQTI